MSNFDLKKFLTENKLTSNSAVVSEQPMDQVNAELMTHLKQAVDVAQKSYELAQASPDDANPTFGQEVAQMLKAIYNALSTGDSSDDSYADEIFK